MGNLKDCDMDVFRLYFLKHLGWYDLGLNITYGREGEGSIDEKDIFWGMEGQSYPEEFFLVGTVQKTFTINPVVAIKTGNYFIRLSVSGAYVENYNHEPGRQKYLTSFLAFLTYAIK